MTESEFNARVDDILSAIEEAIEESGAPVDYETAGGILTLAFENGSKIIINRQTPVRQVWVAAKSGGFHYDFDAEGEAWRQSGSGEELFAALSRLCSAQAGVSVVFPLR